jgi:hypothetical protein
VQHLKSLKAIAIFSLLSHNLKNAVHHLSTFGVVALRKIITSSMASGDEVIGIEETSDGRCSKDVRLSWIEIDDHAARHKTAIWSALVVDVEALIREDVVAVEVTALINRVFIGNYLPELKRFKSWD